MAKAKNNITQSIIGGFANKNQIDASSTNTDTHEPTPTAKQALDVILSSYAPTENIDTTEGVELLTPKEIANIVLAATDELLSAGYIYQQLVSAGFNPKLLSVPSVGLELFFPAQKK